MVTDRTPAGNAQPVRDPADAGVARGLVAATVEVVEASRLQGRSMHVFEVSTRHHRYLLDAERRCVAAIHRETGLADPAHVLLGAVVVGGQGRSDEHAETSVPLPVPGLDAIFQRRVGRRLKVWSTSRVEHVAINVHRVRLH